MKIFLDTNALYSYMGINQNPRVNQPEFLTLLENPDNSVVLNSSSIYEFLVRFSGNLQRVRSGLLFIEEHIDQIYNPLADLRMKSGEIGDLLALSNTNLKHKIKTYRSARIKVEADYATLFLVFALHCVTAAYMEKVRFFEESFVHFYADKMVESQNEIREELSRAISNGYLSGDPKGALRDAFNLIWSRKIYEWVNLIEFLRCDPSPDLTKAEVDAEATRIRSQTRDIKKIIKYTDNIGQWVRELDFKLRVATLIDISNAYRSIMLTKGIHKVQIDYMDFIIVKLGLRGAKFQKNDILDMIIVSVLDEPESILISFDDAIRDFISEMGHISSQYINQVYQG